MKRALLLIVAAGWLAAWCGSLSAAEPSRAGDFENLQRLIAPTDEESKWLQIAWHTDLWEARRLAAAEGKPILLWEMDGHPLGCT